MTSTQKDKVALLRAAFAGITMLNQKTPTMTKSHARPNIRLGPDLRNFNFRGWNLRGKDLQGADLRFADLRDADLRGCDLFGARIDGANLVNCRLEMTRIVEVWIPKALPVHLVNQIRSFDFASVMTRFIGPNRASEQLACPYEHASLRPLLYEWGSKCWREGSDWAPPTHPWTLEEIIASVLQHLGCHHDLQLPFNPHEALSLEASS